MVSDPLNRVRLRRWCLTLFLENNLVKILRLRVGARLRRVLTLPTCPLDLD